MAMVRLRVNAAVLGWSAGDEVTVERSRMVDGLITNQYVTVLEDNVADLPAEITVEPVEFPDTIRLAPEIGGPIRAELSAKVTVVPPRSGKGSTVEAWREFLAGQEIHAPADATKPVLIGLWDSRMAVDHPTPE